MQLTKTNMVIALLDDVNHEGSPDDKIANLERIAECASRMARGVRQRKREERQPVQPPAPAPLPRERQAHSGDLKTGDIVEVQYIQALAPDLWVACEVTAVEDRKFEAKALHNKTFPGGYTHVAIPLGGEGGQGWRRARW